MSLRNIHLDGMPPHIIDTAGLRTTTDTVEKSVLNAPGLKSNKADRVLFMVDGTTTHARNPHDIWPDFLIGYQKTRHHRDPQ